ncbi:LOW QUALITY PROTEIN: insulin-like growth factor-binding protein 1 [Ammospiza nelsoni]|uniref:LOW QUALITY PROTEIN: insulin-like growth factor-binding protein 1 n=1 Tax=Ammospiza caudacuta TaxID=2857398 RepID=UPI002738E36F|nr:LOW QUALITY PROTEIN: insulin-like growth factor-binding protein 1 [Ammospiza caudacuta]XP_059338654.1 LOW QUALITY PROTEIN: insulin-like growth factor-binding protein 1 [Ammospiza nelsoni]
MYVRCLLLSGRPAALARPLLSGMSGPQCALCRGWLRALLLRALLLLQAARLARGAQPVLCAPCTPERLALCPPVPPDCPEAARQPGCGCCQICALGPGQPCGVYTARCRLGLRCRIPAGESRPLFALIQGHGTCLPASEAGEMRTEERADSIEPDDMPLESTEITQDQLLNYQLMFPIGQDKSIPWNSITAYENMKAKRISELKKWKEQSPCQKELYRSLYKLVKAQRSRGEIYKFYLPNCNKNGFYHSKQCETLLNGESAECWCVYPKNGRRIPGSPAIKGDPECQQYLSSQE